MVEDHVVASPGSEYVAVPCEGSNPGGVSSQVPQLLHPCRIPNLDIGASRSNGDVLSVCAPLDARHVVVLVLAGLHQLLNVS
eukprot:CAMPEP_0198241142 /NCGR_PEP_ID=MMETSP1446-20131203/6031_1 /TAXON_ID=1461542 ORGANISM="Unidentified sp, Strain CCMP2111" /NCGR_SAMPLE_ID=MMETSP1446 /ASSEMBLY_ACC=CAM_ASM_001112 /LENGTH=81 /DNA_ID=CAMNT_0043923943 /DNA_START=54 /DNA_END=295 /DNA_ORIENTATION=+